MPTITKLDIKKAIILEDARRIIKDLEPINNIRKLAIEIEAKYPEYEVESLYPTLWRVNKTGHHGFSHGKDMEKIIDAVCDVLNIEKEKLIVIVRR